MGLITSLIEMKANNDLQAKKGAIDAFQRLAELGSQGKLTKEGYDWAEHSLISLLGPDFGIKGGKAGAGGGGQGGKGAGQQDSILHRVLGKVRSGLGTVAQDVNPFGPMAGTKRTLAADAASRPQDIFLTPDQQAEQQNRLEAAVAQNQAQIQAKIDAAKLKQKRIDDQTAYEEAYQRNLKAYPNDPVKAREIAEEEVYNKNKTVEPKPLTAAQATEQTFDEAYAAAHGRDPKQLTAAEKIAAVKEGKAGEKPDAAPKPETTAQVQQRAYADAHGKKVEDLTATEKIAAVRDARVAERLPQRAPLQSGVGGPVPDIKPGTPDYKVAQDLSTGKLTFPEFRGLFSYSRDATKRAAIYQKATELNPEFDAAAFERGFKFSSNVSVQKQIASLNNVRSGVNDLLKFSDQAARTGIPILNRALIKGGINIGGRTYSNFNTARTAFADELSGALGYGSATDMSREMGFNMTDPALSPEAFRSAIQTVIIPFIERKQKSLTEQMGPYGGGSSGTGGGNSAPAPKTADDYLKKHGL